LSELRLIAGMSDDIYENLKPMITVYHTSEKINVCLAEEDVTNALIVHFTQHSECTSPLDPEKDKDEIAEIRSEVLSFCPDKATMATTLNNKLGIAEEDLKKKSETEPTGCKIKFEDLITDSNDIFNITASGNVQGHETRLHIVLDTSSSKTNSWKVLYYQVD